MDHFGVSRIIYENMTRPVGGDDLAKRQQAWDDLNRVALEKLRVYVSVRVDDMVTQGEEVTARVYYQRLEAVFEDRCGEASSRGRDAEFGEET